MSNLAQGWYFGDRIVDRGGGHSLSVHDYDIVTLVVRGELRESFKVGEQRCTRWSIHYKPKGEPHETGTGPEGVRMLLVAFDREKLQQTGQAGFREPQAFNSGAGSARLLELLLKLSKWRDGFPHGAIESVLRCVSEAHRRRQPQAETPSWMTEVWETVNATPHPPSLTPLARQFLVHPVYLARVFRTHFGCSIGDVRRATRVRAALEQLAGTTPLAHVADHLGYADQSHLSREFKLETGWSPGAFRQQAQRLSRMHDER